MQRNDGRPSRSAIYAQQRRDNETNARIILQKHLAEDHGRHIPPEIEERGDFNMTTKVLATTLKYLDEAATLPTRTDRKLDDVNSREYNAARRAHEKLVTAAVKQKLPECLASDKDWESINLNPTTKVIVDATEHLRQMKHEQSFPKMSKRLMGARVKAAEAVFANNKGSTSAYESVMSSNAPPESVKVRPILKRDRSEVADSGDEDSLLPAPQHTKPLGAKSPPRFSSVGKPLDLKPPPLTTTSPVDRLSIYMYSASTASPGKPSFAMKERRNAISEVKKKKKKNHASHPWNEGSVAEHPCVQIRELEQAAKRLIAKAKMMIEPVNHGPTDEVCSPSSDLISNTDKQQLEFVHDLLLDMTSYLEDSAQKRSIKSKWLSQTNRWAKDGVIE